MVLLKDGTRYRGVISERVPGRRLIIVLASGETKRVPLHRVAYAGSAEGASAYGPLGLDGAHSTQALPAEGGGDADESERKVKVTFESPMPNTQLHLRTGSQAGQLPPPAGFILPFGPSRLRSESFEFLCQAPCELELPVGTYTFGVSEGNEVPAAARTLVEVDEPLTLEGQYVSRTRVRAGGWIILIAGTVLGAVLVGASSEDCDPGDTSCDGTNESLLYVGTGLIPVSILTD